MKRPRTPSVAKPKSLAEQKSDFTAEGAPPPGPVAGTRGRALQGLRHAPSRTPAGIPGANRRAPTGKRG
jgi:hypothetical protein